MDALRLSIRKWHRLKYRHYLALNASLLGARLPKSVTENHTLRIVQRLFWCDLTTVLAWLQSVHLSTASTGNLWRIG